MSRVLELTSWLITFQTLVRQEMEEEQERTSHSSLICSVRIKEDCLHGRLCGSKEGTHESDL